MKLNIPKELFDTYDDEEKSFLRENFRFNSSGDRCWHLKEGVEEKISLDEITNKLSVYPTVTWSPTKEKYQSLSEGQRTEIRDLFYWNKKQAVWESRAYMGEEARDFLFSINECGSFDVESTLSNKIYQGLKELRTSEQYKEWLNSLSKFTHYSVNNQIMIAMQNLDATHVAGKAMWYKNFDRKLKSDAVGIYIKAPRVVEEVRPEFKELADAMGYDTSKLPKTKVVKGYFLTKVYDISETYGPDLPQAPVYQLTGDVENFEMFKAAIIEAAKPSEVFFVPASELGTANGSFSHLTKAIKIKDNLSPEQTIKTMLHEVAHAKMHDMDLEINQDVVKPRALKEFEAESAAYILCQKYGIDSSDYSFGYVAGWAENISPAEMEKSLITTATAASQISKKLDAFFEAVPQLEMQSNIDSSGTVSKMEMSEMTLQPQWE